MPTESEMRSRRDSWPPTQVRLDPFRPAKDEPRPLLLDEDDEHDHHMNNNKNNSTTMMDEDPFNYFLTPAPLLDDDVDVGVFDAGIENPSSPREIVRSVSPSTLSQGLSSRRPISPDLDSDALTTDDDEDDEAEEYVRFGAGASSSGPFNFKLLTLSEFAIDGVRRRSSSRSFLSPAGSPPSSRPNRHVLQQAASFPGPQYQPRGRGGYGRGRPTQPRSFSASSSRARANHLWREPSPDVWSISEETEEEMMSESGDAAGASKKGKGPEKKMAKAFKKVRFALPDME